MFSRVLNVPLQCVFTKITDKKIPVISSIFDVNNKLVHDLFEKKKEELWKIAHNFLKWFF